jgi:hypothetical protein
MAETEGTKNFNPPRLDPPELSPQVQLALEAMERYCEASKQYEGSHRLLVGNCLLVPEDEMPQLLNELQRILIKHGLVDPKLAAFVGFP